MFTISEHEVLRTISVTILPTGITAAVLYSTFGSFSGNLLKLKKN
jgi:hypothetical protein